MAAKYSHQKKLGYDTFDDIVDISYENESDCSLRIQLAIKPLEQLMNKIEKKKIDNEDIQQRLKKNKQKFLKCKITVRTVNKWAK